MLLVPTICEARRPRSLNVTHYSCSEIRIRNTRTNHKVMEIAYGVETPNPEGKYFSSAPRHSTQKA